MRKNGAKYQEVVVMERKKRFTQRECTSHSVRRMLNSREKSSAALGTLLVVGLFLLLALGIVVADYVFILTF